MMPSGPIAVAKHVLPILEKVAARVNPHSGLACGGATPGKPIEGGEACVGLVGPEASGDFIKTTHNGIEYLIMQMIGEAVWLAHAGLGIDAGSIGAMFERMNRESDLLSTFLIEATGKVLKARDPKHPDQFLIWNVLDVASTKGTGPWTVRDGVELGAVIPGIAESVLCRYLSSLKSERIAAAKLYPAMKGTGASKYRLDLFIPKALRCGIILAYAQGFSMLKIASDHYGWNLDLAQIARIWRGGCVIRSSIMQHIVEAYERDPGLPNLMLDQTFKNILEFDSFYWKEVLHAALDLDVPVPGLASCYFHFRAYTREVLLWAQVVQCLRDLFGHHGLYRMEGDQDMFHGPW
jgi:6-phosphogluconate dehydrogenase